MWLQTYRIGIECSVSCICQLASIESLCSVLRSIIASMDVSTLYGAKQF